MRLLVIFILFSALGLPVQAYLGDSEDQCIKQYGILIKAVNPGEMFNGVIVNYRILVIANEKNETNCYFIDGKNVAIYFTKLDATGFNNDEKQAILDANRMNHSWSKLSTVGDRESWSRDDGGVFASYGGGRDFCIVTNVFLKAESERQKAAQ